MKHYIGPPPLKTTLSSLSAHKRLPPVFSPQLSSLLFPALSTAQQAPLLRTRDLDVKAFLSPDREAVLFVFQETFLHLGNFFLASYGKLLHHFPKI